MNNATLPLRKVLIVEDEKVMMILVTRLFTRGEFGVELLTATTIREGVDLVDKYEFALLVTDMSLPDGRGIDVIRRFREKFPEAPIIVMSGSLTIQAEVDAISGARVSGVLQKPFTVDDFHNAVATALQTPTRGS